MNEQLTDQFDKYIHEKFTLEEEAEFVEILNGDEEMTSQFKEYMIVVQGIEAANDVVLRERLDKIHEDVIGKYHLPVYKPFKKERILYAAAIIIGIITISSIVDAIRGPAPADLFAEYYQQYQAPSVTRDNSAISSDWNSFIRTYDQREHEKALIILGEVEKNELQPVYLIRFYQGICLLALEQPDPASAVKCFDEVLHSDNDFHDQAMWYKAMASLQAGQAEQAQTILLDLSESSNYKDNQVRELLSEF
jgi:hypothetical protein